MWRYEQLFIFSVGVWLGRRGDERKMPSIDAQFIVSVVSKMSSSENSSMQFSTGVTGAMRTLTRWPKQGKNASKPDL